MRDWGGKGMRIFGRVGGLMMGVLGGKIKWWRINCDGVIGI